MPRVSVIIAAYNVERTLQACLEALLNQSFQDFEIILCDDASSDGTLSLARRMAQRDGRIRVHANERNLGSGATRNRCFSFAQGEYVAIQDADDLSHEDRLLEQVAVLDGHPQFGIVGSAVYLAADGVVWGKRDARPYPENRDFLWGIPYIHPSVMMRKDAVDQVHGYRQARETRRMEDYDLFARMHAAGIRGCNIQNPLYYYSEDMAAYKRRKYRYRIDEAIVRCQSFKALSLFPAGFLYILKPLVVGLIPDGLLRRRRQRRERLRGSSDFLK